MKQLLLLVAISVALNTFIQNLLFGDNNCQTKIDAIGTVMGKTDSQPLENSIEVELSGLPRSLFFGDTFYHFCVVTNNGDKPVEFSDYNYSIIDRGRFIEGFRFLLSAEGVSGQYDCLPEIYTTKYMSIYVGRLTLSQGESIKLAHPLEFPPLEALEHPFWKQVQEKMTPEGLKCTLTTRIPKHYADKGVRRNPLEYMDYTLDIILKPRPADEQALLEKWYRETPKQFFPPVSLSRVDDQKWWYTEEMVKFEKVGYHHCNGNYIEIAGEKYNPWCFIRDGNRKPPAVICPTTLAGWKTLEESLVPSTMRDEITLIRQQLEYYGSEGEEQERILKDLYEWLESLPEPQRMSMSSSLQANITIEYIFDEFGRPVGVRQSPSREKLIKSLFPMMSHYHRKVLERAWKNADNE